MGDVPDAFFAPPRKSIRDHRRLEMTADRKEFGVGIIGYSIGKVHAHGWRGVDEVFHPAKAVPRLVAIAGRNREKVEMEEKRFGFSRAYTDWRDLVADKDVDIVDNCAPPYLHQEACVAAAEAGKNLICEKPMARTAKEAKVMLEAAQKAKVAHMIGYNYRFLPAVVFAKQIINEGLIGSLYYYKGAYLNAAAGYHKQDTPFDWHHSYESGGYGALADLGTHAIDLARYLAGEIVSVQSVSRNFVPSRPETRGSKKTVPVDVDDAAVSVVNFANGALGMIEASWVTPGRLDYLAFEAYGSKGSVMFNLERINELNVQLEEKDPRFIGMADVHVLGREHPYMTKYWVNQAGGFSWENGFVNELHHYLDRLAEGRSVSPEGATFVDGYRNCLIIDAMVESAKSGKRVEIAS
jgi:predicted dehydrogenase